MMKTAHEAFVYLWYDALNKMYYLGKHKGSSDDSYTHSSSIWESFTKDNIPEGVTRRILAYGTHEEMCILEHKLLVNRKKRCWNRYYNNSLGDPRYVDMSRENNPMYKDGRKCNDPVAYKKEYDKIRNQKPERKESEKKRQATPEYKAHEKKRNAERRAKRRTETGYAQGYSQAKNKTERQEVGTLKEFI